MTTLRSEDWAVRPSFVPNGPTSPVVLLADDTTLTQLAGIPVVAWQTPWSEISALELIRFSHQMALFATIGGVRYCWRHRDLTDYDAVRTLVLEHGGVVSRRRRRAGVLVVVGVVVLASFAGGIAAWFNRGSHQVNEPADATSVNLTRNDLPGAWDHTSNAVLNYLVPPAGKIYRFTNTTTTTAPAQNSSFAKAATVFQSCLGVTGRHDRIYGAAGQQPDIQVSSPIFTTNALGGIELASTTQYYRTTAMVEKDTHEMSMTNFGTCFVQSSASLILSGFGLTAPTTVVATKWHPPTFLKGWRRGGVVDITVPGVSAKLQLVMVVITHGHFEVTLSAIVESFAKSQALLAHEANVLVSRVTSTTSRAV
ncbi:MAG: hypothetical protein JWM55_1987 [Acidimicrobiaceae bacterium]|nr:hypothetical protein [Acidimicrobiaceae bacterium]